MDSSSRDYSSQRLLGDYQLKSFVSQTPVKRTWLAEQCSISRIVLIDELIGGDAAARAGFIAEARAKAAVDYPKIASVYEAVDEPDMCFCAYELLPGSTLTDLQLEGQALQAVSLASILQHVAEANIHLENNGHSTSMLCPRDIHVEDSGVVRLKNLAVPGPRADGQSTRDIYNLGETLRDLVARDWPGTNRMLTLLGWMRGENVQESMTWQQVHESCGQICEQLAGVPAKPRFRPFRMATRILLPVTAAAMLISLGIFAWKNMPPSTSKAPRVALAPPIPVPAGSYPTPDGLEQPLEAFQIAGHPATNREYLEFQQILQALRKDGDHRIFDHPEQPEEKTHHDPAGWSALAIALKTDKGPLQDQPVTGVDWWDAYAYANWKKTRLPSQEEWFAAIAIQKEAPAIYEWTLAPAANPSNPLGERLWVLIRKGTPRQWTSSRSTRRTDIGFRIIVPATDK